jgi:nitrogenase iron protein
MRIHIIVSENEIVSAQKRIRQRRKAGIAFMKRIAVYGKGGIGKSTISANLSAAFALAGHRVLQIGCDPKHDSTRLLLQGKRLTTVLDYLRITNPLEYRLEDILEEGFAGIGCVEAGGPKPGVGCAGRGIISTFELLEKFKLHDRYGVTLYDVLGDVVCGGFAVPIRREYADTILIVTSGEFMALYAANNILRGIRNYDGTERRVAGLVYNRRNVEGEDEHVALFAAAVGLPICATVPRSDAFSHAERANRTVIEMEADAEVCAIFHRLAAALDGCTLYEAKPLTDEALEETVLGISLEQTPTEAANSGAEPVEKLPPPAEIGLTDQNRYLSKNLIRGEPLHGCAFNGAVSTAVHLRDALVLAHAPKSCAHISYQTIISSGRRKLFERGALLPASLMPNLECTEMGEPEIVFGGTEKLEERLLALKKQKPRAIVVVSSCPAGIIGDDIDRVKNLSEPGLPVIPVRADGNMAGDYLQGMFMSYIALARSIIKRNVPPVPDTVNIVAEKIVVTNTEDNFSVINGYLSQMGVRVNCRFLYNTTANALENFCAAPLNLPAYGDYTANTLRGFFEKEYGARFFPLAFPVGLEETADWLRGVAAFFGRPDAAAKIIAEHTERYMREIAALRPQLSGKKLMIITYNHELDWILKTALDAGMEIAKIGVLNYSQDEGFRTRLSVSLPVEENYDRERRADDIAAYRPDVLLTNYASSVAEDVPVADTIPMCPNVGFESGLTLARRWARLLQLNVKGAWRQDEQLFKQYYA